MQYKNLASDDKIREKVEEDIWGLLTPIRDNRTSREERWKRHYRIFNCEFDNMSYKGFSKIYVAALRNASETFVTSLVRDLFPSGDWFRVRPNVHVTNMLQAEMLEALFKHFFTKNMSLKSDSLPFMRQLVMYGTSPMKITWKDEERKIIAAELDKSDSGEYVRKFVKKTVNSFLGPYLRPVDLFNFFVYPETANDVDEAELVFEDMEMTLAYIKQMAQTPVNKKKPGLGMVYHFPEGDYELLDINPGYTKQLFSARAERLQQLGIAKDPSDRWNKLGKDRRNLTEIYITRDYDGEGEKQWLLTFLNDSRAIRIQENPFNDKEPPYLVPRYLRILGEFYGRGAYDGSDRLQYMANDVINQTMDSVQYRLNPITVLDPTKVRFAQSIKRHPGARWLADPSGFMETAPIDVSGTGFNAFNLVYGLIHDTSGASAAMQGIPAARGRGRQQNTASGMAQGLQQNSIPLENIVEDLEEQYTKKLLRKTYNLMTQYLDVGVMVRILGSDGNYLAKKVSIEDVMGDYEYEWLGVVSARNKLVMGQQMLQFLNIVRSLPPQVMEGIDWEYIVKRIWTDALNQRDSDEVFLKNKQEFSIDPDLEYEMLLADRDPVVSPADPDMEHMQNHLLKRLKIKDQEKLAKWDRHIDDHMAQAQQKEMAKQQALMEQKQQAEMQKQAQAIQMAKMLGAPGGGGGNEPSQSARNAPQNQPTGLGNNGAADAMRGNPGQGVI